MSLTDQGVLSERGERTGSMQQSKVRSVLAALPVLNQWDAHQLVPLHADSIFL